MKKPTLAILTTVLMCSLWQAHAWVAVGLPGGPDLPESPYGTGFLDSRAITFNVKKGSGVCTASGSYVLKLARPELIPVKGKATIKDLTPFTWDFQLLYTNVNSPRVGDYTFKMNAPLGGAFSNVVFASTNTPPIISGTQAGSFYMTEKRADLSLDTNPDIIWQKDDGHLGIWFMKTAINGTVLDTNLNKGIYLDSLYLATGHKTYDPSWRIASQTDFDLNGMQDWVWQNTNNGALRIWFLADTNFVHSSLKSFDYHSYSVPVVDSEVNPNDFTITTNLTPTSITNYYTKTVTEISSNFLSGPGFEITTFIDDSVFSQTNQLLKLFTTNVHQFVVTNITTMTNLGNTVYLTNIVTMTSNSVTANTYENFTVTNLTAAKVSGRIFIITNVITIPDLNAFSSTEFVVDNIGNSGHTVRTIFAYTNYPDVTRYYTNKYDVTYAEILSGFYLVTYTTNYNIVTTTNFINPFIQEVALEQQSPPDASYRLVGFSDFDMDGYQDFLFRASDGSLFYESYFETFNDALYNGSRYLSSPGNLGWNVVGIIDLNNDGWPDILWQNAKTGATAIWYEKGAYDINLGYIYKHVGNGSLNGGSSMPAWKIAGNADFNHDGQMDVLLRNTSTGQLIFWYLNGSKLLRSSTISGPVMPWQIVGPK